MLGKQRYWLELGNRFDAFVTLAALLASLYVLVPNGYNVRALIRSVFMLRMLRLLRLFKAVPLFRQICFSNWLISLKVGSTYSTSP